MVATYPVTARFPDRGSEGAAQIRFYQAYAELVMADDGLKHELRYDHAQVAWGGLKDEQAVLTLVGYRDEVVRLYFDGRGVFQAPPEPWPADLRAKALALTTRRRWVWAIVPGLAATAAAGWLLLKGFVALAVALVPPSTEIPVGKVFADSVAEGHVVADKTLDDALAGIGNALVAAGPDQPYPFVFRVVDLPVENAMAFPGGQVLVTKKLIAAAATPDELAGVLGHEIAHVERRHVTKQLAQELGLGLALALLLGDVGTAGTLAASYGSRLAGLSYGRGQEAEADGDGVRRAWAAGFDPKGLDAFFRRLEAQAGGSDGPAILSTHPAHADRIAAIDALAAELGPPKPGVRPRLPGWEAVRKAASK